MNSNESPLHSTTELCHFLLLLLPGHMGIPSNEHIKLPLTQVTAHFPRWRQTLISWGDQTLLSDPHLPKQNDCPISLFNKLLMKKTKTPSLTATQFHMKRLYKYIRFRVKVSQNICPPPHWRVVCHSPSHSAHSFCCSTGVQLSPLVIRSHLHVMAGGELKKWLQRACWCFHFHYVPFSSKVHHLAMKTASGTTRLWEMTAQWQPRESTRKCFWATLEYEKAKNVWWIGVGIHILVLGGIKGRMHNGKWRRQADLYLWILKVA